MKASRSLNVIFVMLVSFVAPVAALPARPFNNVDVPGRRNAQYVSTQPALSGGSNFLVTDILAPQGCAMAHCDRAMSDNAKIIPPLASSMSALWHDTSPIGSGEGLGCSSNGSVAVCSFTTDSSRQTPTLIAFTASGKQLWSSSLLNATAYTSAPIIDPSGGVIAADSERLIRFDPEGDVVWNTTTAGGTPISPTFTDNGMVILATWGGPVSAYDVQTGDLIGQLPLADTLLIDGQSHAGLFDTVNTPAVSRNRMYISTRFRPFSGGDVQSYGRLYALDIQRAGDGSQAQISIAWYHEFRGPSGASPLIIRDGTHNVIVFDGSGMTPDGPSEPSFFAVRDLGASPEFLWQYKMRSQPIASAAADPRGGFWVFAPLYPELLRLSSSGKLLQGIDLNSLVGESGDLVPYSAVTIAGAARRPIMLVSAVAKDYSSSYVTAIDLAKQRILWKYRVDQDKGRQGSSIGQFPIVKTAYGRRVVVLSTVGNGAWGLSATILSAPDAIK